MNKKQIILSLLLAATLLICFGCQMDPPDSGHAHSFGEWEVLSPADCDSAAVEVRRCGCGEEETREGAPASGHSFTAISAQCLLESPMASMVITPDDLQVTGTCACGNVVITDGFQVEGETLVLGENTVTVRYGTLSASLTVQAAELDITLDAVVVDDTYVASGSQDSENSVKMDLGTNSDQFRSYFRVNVGEILKTRMFAENGENAKVQMILSVTAGYVTEDTAVMLKAFDPALPECDAEFSGLTWNSVDNKEGEQGAYANLHWHNGVELISVGANHNVQIDHDHITVTLAYSQIAEFVDEEGNILFAFATNTKDLKVGSLENKTETNHPVFRIILNGEHFHVFDRKAAEQEFFISANCREKARYYVSCACGAAGTEIFEHGDVISHNYGGLIPKVERTCTEDGMKAHYRCSVCGKYFAVKDGEKVVTSAAYLTIPAGHNCGKLIEQKDPTCTEEGMKAHYRCDRCKKYFVEVDGQKVEVSKDELKIPKLAHTYSELVPKVEKTCTEDGMKSHYRCTVCGKFFAEKDGEKVATSEASLRLPAGHNYGQLIEQKDPTCTEEGMKAHYRCDRCKKYFVEVDGQKVEVSKDELKIPKLAHTYSELVPKVEKTCTEDGMKSHYRCTVCGKFFVEKDGSKVAVSEGSLRISAGHDMEMKWDETHHWSECTAGCGYETEHEAHYTNLATETEEAKCEVCGQNCPG